MADLFEQFGVEAPKPTAPPADVGVDLFEAEGIAPPTIAERNSAAMARLSPVGPVGSINSTLVSATGTAVDDDNNLNVLAASRFTPEQISDFKANPITWGKAQDYLDYADVIPAGGAYRGYELLRASNAAGKLERGETLTDSEQKLLYGIVDKNIEMSLRGFSIGGGIKYYSLQLPAFMTEFAATAGIGKLAQQSVVKGAEKLAVEGVKSAVLKSTGNAAVKTAGFVAKAGVRTAGLPSLYISKYGERRLNDEVAITDKGDLLLKESAESPAKSALMAYSYSLAEVASEMSGVAIGKYVTDPALAVVKTPLVYGINNLPVPVQEALYTAYKAVKPNAKIAEVFTAAGWNGMLNELGEERVADVLKATLGLTAEKDFGFDDYLDAITPSKEQLLIESGVIAIAGGVKTSADLTMNLMLKRGTPQNEANEMVGNMTANEQDDFVNKNLHTPRGTFTTDLTVMSEGEMVESQIKAAERQDPPRIDNSESMFTKFHREWVNELEPIQSLPAKAEERGLKVPLAENTKLLTTAYAGTLGAIRQNLQVATFTKDELGNNVITGKALKPILDDFSAKMMPFEPKVAQREKDFGDYLVARRYLEDLSDREDVEVTEEQKLQSLETMTRILEKYGDNTQFFETFAQEIYEFQRRILQNLVSSGVMSEESFNGITSKNKNYIPFDRVLEDEQFQGGVSTNGVFTKANANRIVKGIKGSDKDVKNVFHSVIRNTARIIDMSRRNEVARSIAGLAETLPEYIQKVPTPMAKVGEVTTEDGESKAIFRPSPFQPKGTILVREGGKKQYYEVSQPILQAVESIGANDINFVEKIFQTSASVLRAGATLVPEFWIRNVLRDQQTALLQSGVNYRPTDFARGLFAVMGKTELYNEWERSGGSFNSYMELDDKGIEKAYKELFRTNGRLMRYLNPINIAADISGGLEKATRVGLFGRARAEGQSALEATLTARDATLNFARRGSQGKRVNRVIPFFNAGVQGSDKLIRTFKNNPQAAVFWGLTTITLPSLTMAGYYLYAAPEDERREYLEIPQWQRDMFWVAKIGGEWHRYPKPFTFGYLFGTMPEHILQWMYDGDKPEGRALWLELAMGIAGSVIPIYEASSFLPPLMKTSIETITNYNFFTGRPIYPEWMEKLDPEQRSNKYTSETAKFVGKQFGVPPAMVDNALRGQIAGSADYVTRAGDYILEQTKKWNGESVPEKPLTQSDIAVVKTFAVRRPSGYRSVSSQEFFDNLEEAQQRRTTFKRLKGEERRAYQQEHAKEISLYGAMDEAYDQMNDLQDQIDAIYEHKTMSADDKIERINTLEDRITEVARKANRRYNAALKGAPDESVE